MKPKTRIFIATLSLIFFISLMSLLLLNKGLNLKYIEDDSYYILAENLDDRIIFLYFEKEREDIKGELNSVSADENIYFEELQRNKQKIKVNSKEGSIGNEKIEEITGEKKVTVKVEDKGKRISYTKPSGDVLIYFKKIDKESLEEKISTLEREIDKKNKLKEKEDTVLSKEAKKAKDKLDNILHNVGKISDFTSEMVDAKNSIEKLFERVEKYEKDLDKFPKSISLEEYCQANPSELNCFFVSELKEIVERSVFVNREKILEEIDVNKKKLNEILNFVIENSLKMEVNYDEEYLDYYKKILEKKINIISNKEKKIKKKLGI